jgi:hypothetical protein
MLATPTLDKLHAMKLPAMAQAWTEQQQHTELTALAASANRRSMATFCPST